MPGADALADGCGLLIEQSLDRGDFRLEVALSLPGGGITVLFGPSGCGKTTVLRCLAGLEAGARGTVRIRNQTWQDDRSGVRLPPWRRSLGYVFQQGALFPHLNVRRNLEFGMRRARRGGGAATLQDAVRLLGIGHLLHRSVGSLSGGEQQRVAIARALATQPDILLLDEPLAALDPARRQDVLPWLEGLRDHLGMPMLYVTHSVDEVARLADQLVVMEHGSVTASGPAAEVFSGLGHAMPGGADTGSLLHATVVERDTRWGLIRAQFRGGSFWITDSGQALHSALRLRVPARDVSIQLQQPTLTSIVNHCRAVVDSVVAEKDPSQALVRLDVDPQGLAPQWLLARITRRSVAALNIEPGAFVWAQVKSVAVAR